MLLRNIYILTLAFQYLYHLTTVSSIDRYFIYKMADMMANDSGERSDSEQEFVERFQSNTRRQYICVVSFYEHSGENCLNLVPEHVNIICGEMDMETFGSILYARYYAIFGVEIPAPLKYKNTGVLCYAGDKSFGSLNLHERQFDNMILADLDFPCLFNVTQRLKKPYIRFVFIPETYSPIRWQTLQQYMNTSCQSGVIEDRDSSELF